jgi:hypothetical protein
MLNRNENAEFAVWKIDPGSRARHLENGRRSW